MSKINKSNIKTFLSSRKGRLFFHFLYSIGAAVVIIGVLFKIQHWPGGSVILVIGLITEACVFALSAFDTDQIESLPEESANGYANGGNGVTIVGNMPAGASNISGEGGQQNDVAAIHTSAGVQGGNVVVGGGVIGGGLAGGVTSAVGGGGQPQQVQTQVSPTAGAVSSSSGVMPTAGGTDAQAATTLSNMSSTILNDLEQFVAGSGNITEDGAELSKNIKELNTSISNFNQVFENQLRAISDQANTITYINDSISRIRAVYDSTLLGSMAFRDENDKMTRQIQELNKVYTRLLQAMNVGGAGANPATNIDNNNPNPTIG